MSNWPCGLVTAVRAAPLDAARTVTCAPGTAAPDRSATEPAISPRPSTTAGVALLTASLAAGLAGAIRTAERESPAGPGSAAAGVANRFLDATPSLTLGIDWSLCLYTAIGMAMSRTARTPAAAHHTLPQPAMTGRGGATSDRSTVSKKACCARKTTSRQRAQVDRCSSTLSCSLDVRACSAKAASRFSSGCAPRRFRSAISSPLPSKAHSQPALLGTIPAPQLAGTFAHSRQCREHRRSKPLPQPCGSTRKTGDAAESAFSGSFRAASACGLSSTHARPAAVLSPQDSCRQDSRHAGETDLRLPVV